VPGFSRLSFYGGRFRKYQRAIRGSSQANRMRQESVLSGITGIGHIGPKTSVKLLRPVTHPRGLERRLHV